MSLVCQSLYEQPTEMKQSDHELRRLSNTDSPFKSHLFQSVSVQLHEERIEVIRKICNMKEIQPTVKPLS